MPSGTNLGFSPVYGKGISGRSPGRITKSGQMPAALPFGIQFLHNAEDVFK